MAKRALELETPPALWKLLRGFETNCFADCCQLRAFDLERHRLDAWIADWGTPSAEAALDGLEALIYKAEVLDDEVRIEVSDICFRGLPAQLVEGLRPWRRALGKAIKRAR